MIRSRRSCNVLFLPIEIAMKREKRKADSYYDREQTRNCIGGGGTPRLTTLCRSTGSSNLLLQRFHLLLVCLLFLCKPRKPTCVTLRVEFLWVRVHDDSTGRYTLKDSTYIYVNLMCVQLWFCVKRNDVSQTMLSSFRTQKGICYKGRLSDITGDTCTSKTKRSDSSVNTVPTINT